MSVAGLPLVHARAQFGARRSPEAIVALAGARPADATVARAVSVAIAVPRAQQARGPIGLGGADRAVRASPVPCGLGVVAFAHRGGAHAGEARPMTTTDLAAGLRAREVAVVAPPARKAHGAVTAVVLAGAGADPCHPITLAMSMADVAGTPGTLSGAGRAPEPMVAGGACRAGVPVPAAVAAGRRLIIRLVARSMPPAGGADDARLIAVDTQVGENTLGGLATVRWVEVGAGTRADSCELIRNALPVAIADLPSSAGGCCTPWATQAAVQPHVWGITFTEPGSRASAIVGARCLGSAGAGLLAGRPKIPSFAGAGCTGASGAASGQAVCACPP
mmetsp:Transcript_33337/g.59698  ORF Transcript_33337/g.59698 Transcript_33337/m.59698 type:complete len:334 (-) Transcript_33337:1764-2765(-)